MFAQALTHVDPQQFFRFPSTNATEVQRLDTKVSGVAISNDFSGRLSVTTAEGDTITLSADQQSQLPVTTSDTATPGVAPSAVAVIPQSSTGTSAPTQPSPDTVVPTSDATTRLVASAQNASHPKSLVQQVLDALDASKVESHKVHKYLPDFFQKLREDLRDELRGHHEQPSQTPAAGESDSPVTTVSGALFAYQATRLTSVSLSIRT